MSRPAALVLLMIVTTANAAPPAASGAVTIYRCTDARGQLALRDSPCHAGERQQVRTMARPTDPPPRVSVATVHPPAAPAYAAPRDVVYRTEPRPLYECTTPDGETYTSENPEGNPRWVPLWTLGYPIVVGVPVFPRPTPHGGGGGMVVQRPGSTMIGTGVGSGIRHRPPPVELATVPGGSWIRDVCYSLPASEVCSQMRDRREALDRRWFSALQGDRDAIEREQRSLDARLVEECG
ncbi:DUF4124 domain-containing protein [Lysobacter claricitrinus]|uniref:DUF4124 domain-containing protein n=1 Tax=Lysobacter claricitrinus TaxID=3367728 RepID=UPI0037DB9C50